MKDGLEATIKSVLNQSEASNIEFIVIDGGSDDGSIEVIEKYKSKIDIIKIEGDKGIFDAMNKGINLSNGKYCYYLNSGDEFASNDVLEVVINTITETNSEYNIIHGSVATYRFNEYIGLSKSYPWLAHQSAFVKRDLLLDYRFDESLKIFGDLDLWTRLRKDGKYICYEVDKVIANMELDGIGSNPKYILFRLQDKFTFAKKHSDFGNFIETFVVAIVGYFVFKIFGEKFYYHHYISILERFKRIIKKEKEVK
ncbi:MAG: glycosyl transferase [Candidatus Cloacimonadota bacterium]|nr:MAG: glycosyl transferase [Candidatus Cloacimonadota bacterium]